MTSAPRVHTLRNISIPGSAGLPILLDVFYASLSQHQPVIVFCHGFKGFKDWGHFDLIAEQFAANGLVFLKFNFSHNGTSPDRPTEFADLDAFGRNNYIIELEDLNLVLQWLEQSADLRAHVDTGRIFLLGHSRGGGIDILAAAEDQRIKKLCTWASVCTFLGRNNKSTIKAWMDEGVVYTTNARTGQRMPLYRQFYDVMIENRERLDVLAAARKLRIPFMIVHGSADEAVEAREAEKLHAAARHSRLFIVEGGSHTFGGKHPYKQKQLHAQAELVVRETISFFRHEE